MHQLACILSADLTLSTLRFVRVNPPHDLLDCILLLYVAEGAPSMSLLAPGTRAVSVLPQCTQRKRCPLICHANSERSGNYAAPLAGFRSRSAGGPRGTGSVATVLIFAGRPWIRGECPCCTPLRLLHRAAALAGRRRRPPAAGCWRGRRQGFEHLLQPLDERRERGPRLEVRRPALLHHLAQRRRHRRAPAAPRRPI